jgi:hypothetical protein
LGKIRKFQEKSGGRDRQALEFSAGGDGFVMAMIVMAMVMRVALGVRAPFAAGLGARTQRFIHDLADGPGTTTALGAAAKAAIDLPRRARQIAGVSHSVADVVVANDVAGTNDHGFRSAGPVKRSLSIKCPRGRMQRQNRHFQAIPNWRPAIWNESKLRTVIDKKCSRSGCIDRDFPGPGSQSFPAADGPFPQDQATATITIRYRLLRRWRAMLKNPAISRLFLMSNRNLRGFPNINRKHRIFVT